MCLKHFNELGLYSLAGLFRSCEILNDIMEQKRSGKKRKKREYKNFSSNLPKDLTCFYFKTDSNGQILNARALGYKGQTWHFPRCTRPALRFQITISHRINLRQLAY